MFKCQNCNQVSKPNETRKQVVTDTRVRVYQHMDEEGYPYTTQGTEILKEVGVCNECKRRYDQIHGK